MNQANNISVATFASLWGYKFEAYDASVWAPKVLADAGIVLDCHTREMSRFIVLSLSSGVKLILKTDHPVIFAADLMHNAAMAHFYNLSSAGMYACMHADPACLPHEDLSLQCAFCSPKHLFALVDGPH